jgi:ureidoglycolate amidohydrolase
VNSVPNRVRLELDVRDIDRARRDSVLEAIAKACDGVASRRRVTAHRELLNADPPAQCSPDVIGALEDSVLSHGLTCDHMISRAYHDSLFMSRIAPTAMLFIPCRNGVSHTPDEYASPEAIAQGTLILAEALARLAGAR